jgi:hypothetical protein
MIMIVNASSIAAPITSTGHTAQPPNAVSDQTEDDQRGHGGADHRTAPHESQRQNPQADDHQHQPGQADDRGTAPAPEPANRGAESLSPGRRHPAYAHQDQRPLGIGR